MGKPTSQGKIILSALGGAQSGGEELLWVFCEALLFGLLVNAGFIVILREGNA